MNKLDVKKIIKEEVKKSLLENREAKKVILESRLLIINEMISLSEADFINRAKQWLKSKAFGAEQGVRDTVKNSVMVNPEKIVSDPNSVQKILDTAIKNAQSQITKFRSQTLQTSTSINNLQDNIFDLFGKFFNLLDSIPQEKRGQYEREVMKVVSVFYNLLMEEKKRIEVYISALAREASTQGYNMGSSSPEMSSYSGAKISPTTQATQGKAAVGGSALIPQGVRESLDVKKKVIVPRPQMSMSSNEEEASSPVDLSDLERPLESLMHKNKIPWFSMGTRSSGDQQILIIKMSLDNKSNWLDGILHNSRWAQASIELHKGVYTVEQRYGTIKPILRSAKVLTPEAAFGKFEKWLSQVQV